VLLRCTARLLEVLGDPITEERLASQDDWYANVFWVQRRNAVTLWPPTPILGDWAPDLLRMYASEDQAEERSGARGTFERDMGTAADTPLDRVAERQRAVALARHYREAEGLSIAQIAERLGRAPATIKGYFYDPTGEKARAVKARYVGVCRGCGAYTQPRNGKGDAYRYCKRCNPGAIQPKWTQDLVIVAIFEWQRRYGCLPSSDDWSRTHARRRGGDALKRLNEEEWPPASVVSKLFGSWHAARQDGTRLAGSAAGPISRNLRGTSRVGAVPQ
jgi:AraC-like DNA-binding protein